MPVDVAEWKRVQAELRSRVVVAPLDPPPRFVAGADCAFSADRVFAVALVWDRDEDRVVDLATHAGPLDVPYVPGFLSFREGPAILAAVGKLTHDWGAVTFDGQGLAHPRRCGLATHLGVTLDRPAVGVAKSLFVGRHGELPAPAGSAVDLTDKGETVGRALRTRDRVRPVYVSVGHRCDLGSACALALACVTRYRIPEPTRLADAEVAKFKKRHASE